MILLAPSSSGGVGKQTKANALYPHIELGLCSAEKGTNAGVSVEVAVGHGVTDRHFNVTEARGMRRKPTLMSPSIWRLRQNLNAGRDFRNAWFSLSCFCGKKKKNHVRILVWDGTEPRSWLRHLLAV